MHCPFCGADDTKVIDSRLVAEGDSVRRRRECQTCGERFTTFETAELVKFGQMALALLNVVGQSALGLVLVLAGIALGRLL